MLNCVGVEGLGVDCGGGRERGLRTGHEIGTPDCVEGPGPSVATGREGSLANAS